MRQISWATRLIIPSILMCGGAALASEPGPFVTNVSLMPHTRIAGLHVEVAGADDTDAATEDELKDAGTNMVPSENLKKAMPLTQPTAQPEKEEPRKLEAMPVKTPEPEKPATPEKMPMAQDEAEPEAPASEAPMEMAGRLSGPYIRLDVGHAFTRDSDGTQTAGDFSAESIGDAITWGGGVGYKFDQNLRGDVTFTYRPDADVSATTSAGNTASTEVNALSVMVNAYWDFDPIDKITPYLGAGIGLAHLDTSDQTTTGGVATETGATSDNFAWSFVAGAAYEVLDNAAVDVNYRFINMGEFKQAVSTTYDDLMAHEVRAGLRVHF